MIGEMNEMPLLDIKAPKFVAEAKNWSSTVSDKCCQDMDN